MERLYSYADHELEIKVLKEALSWFPSASNIFEIYIGRVHGEPKTGALTHYDGQIEEIRLAIQERIDRLEAEHIKLKYRCVKCKQPAGIQAGNPICDRCRNDDSDHLKYEPLR